MPAPGTWPREAPRPTDSHAERAVWDALRRGLPAGWYAWHSLRIRDRHNIDGEGDFVIAAPGRGLLVLEVKGGTVELRDGRWLQNGREMRPQPREQANRYGRKLVGRLRDEGCAPPAWGIATCFPDVSYERGPDGGDVRGCVLGREDLIVRTRRSDRFHLVSQTPTVVVAGPPSKPPSVIQSRPH